ncbi:hypothetical protein SO802_013597 [Lithocarpus litseifolius]|uniref:RNase H type-1 domain-containing protein n=1 Tax=Lithocarpus litseifolius TaxID=425828 RepID=A0AAW2DBJ6_9ROSI
MRRNILQDSRCEGCNQEEETAGHLFWTCPRARELWQNSKWVFPVETEHYSSFKELLWSLLMDDQPSGPCNIWKNIMQLQNSLPHPWSQLSMDKHGLLRWILHIRLMLMVPHFQNLELLVSGFGVIVRDAYGQVVAALSSRLMAPLGAIETEEAKALEAGMQFARDVGIQDFILESDSLVLIRSLMGLSSPPSSVASVVQGLLEFCGSNRPAHLLAKRFILIF